MNNLAYWEYYKNRSQEGDYIILDNGAYEGESNMKLVRRKMELLKCNMVALPDFLLDHWKKTWNAAQAFLDLYYTEYLGGVWMYIPQSRPGDMMGFVEGLTRAMDDPRIGAIGIPRALSTKITNDPFARLNVCQYIKKRRPDLYVHALGMSAGDVEELHQLSLEGCDSIDSSAPVWRGWHGWSLEKTSGKTVVGDVDFNAPWHNDGKKDALILKNLEACKVDVSTAGAWQSYNVQGA